MTRRGRHVTPRRLPTRVAAVATGAVIAAAVLVGAIISTTAAPPRNTMTSDPPANTMTSAVPEDSAGELDPGAVGRLQDPESAPAPATVSADAIPTRFEIPELAVNTELEALATDPAGELQAPVDYGRAGWYAAGVVPGRVGPAIIAGHVDSAVGPAVFARLGELDVGTRVLVTLSTGQVLEFEVYEIGQAVKTRFPSSEVYGSVPTAELRIITCAGQFDAAAGGYTDNLILYAALVG
ncbi:sortase domain-bontaining protein [Agromyces sp. NPDC058484]|uniref:sortase domain-containing protein n=1 Tax=Agromyces sp. NPDC058484 TaxID=3346524 RepID=UPI0036678034